MEEYTQSRMTAVLDKDKTNKANYTCSNFHFQTPINVYFGKDAVSHLPELLNGKKNVLLVYGGGSAKRNGAYDAIVSELQANGIRWFDLPDCIGPHYAFVKRV